MRERGTILIKCGNDETDACYIRESQKGQSMGVGDNIGGSDLSTPHGSG